MSGRPIRPRKDALPDRRRPPVWVREAAAEAAEAAALADYHPDDPPRTPVPDKA